MIEAMWGFVAMLALASMRVPIALAMGIAGFGGLWWTQGLGRSVASLTAVVYDSGFNYTLSVLPLFILMGNFVTRAGMSKELYGAANAFVGHLRGGLAMATIIGCAGFGAICGSSIATAATFTKVAYPSMKEHGYSDALATGAIAAGGTLGILIPPSTIMILYGLMTETNIGKLFAAGVIPGIIATFLLCVAVQYITWRDPKAGPRGERFTWKQRLDALRGLFPFLVCAIALVVASHMEWIDEKTAGVIGAAGVVVFGFVYRGVMAVVALFAIVMGGIYGGIFTATEAAAIGAAGAMLFAMARGVLTLKLLHEVLVESATTSAMLFTILIGALVFGNFIGYTSMPGDLKNFVAQYQVHPMLVMTAICIIYVVLGTAMEELSMILLTVPVFFPLIQQLGFDPVWFGIIIVVVVEIGLISPPVGMNMFVVKSLLPNVSTNTIFRGVTPFVFADIIRLAILVALPGLSLWLPKLMKL
jgi:TRAP-type C4-dicarboxylate transport system permease large subunit